MPIEANAILIQKPLRTKRQLLRRPRLRRAAHLINHLDLVAVAVFLEGAPRRRNHIRNRVLRRIQDRRNDKPSGIDVDDPLIRHVLRILIHNANAYILNINRIQLTFCSVHINFL